MAVKKVPRTDDSSIKSYSTIPPKDPPGGGGGGPNIVESVEVGIDLQTRLSLAGDSTPVDVGMDVGIGPLAVATPVEMGLSLTDLVTGTTRDGADIGLDLSTALTLQGSSTPVDAGARIEGVFIDLVRLSGGDAVTEEAVAGRTDWANDANVLGPPGGASATIAGNAVGARGGRLVLDYAAFTNKSFLIIDSVKLRFYTSTTGTIGNNGDLKHQWRRITGGAWTTLATFTGNQDSSGTPAVYDITTSIGSWADLEALQTGISFESAIGELQTAAATSVEIEIVAHLNFDPADVPGLAAWYRADGLTFAAAPAATIATWDNNEGTASRDMTQATAGNRPTMQHNVINGKPVLRFDSTDFMENATAFLAGSAGSIFAVVRLSTVVGSHSIFTSSDEASNTRFVFVRANGTHLEVGQQNNDTAETIGTSAGTVATATNYIVEFHSTGTAYGIVINGVDQGLTVLAGANNGDWFADTSARDNTVIGAAKLLAGVVLTYSSDLAELIVYDGVVLTDEEKTNIRETYLADKYGITV